MKNAAIGLIVLGLISLGVSAVWPKISPKPEAMDEQQAERFDKAVGDAHGALPGSVAEEDKEIIEQVKQEREGAAKTEELGTKVFRYVGILAALVGAGLFFWAAQSED